MPVKHPHDDGSPIYKDFVRNATAIMVSASEKPRHFIGKRILRIRLGSHTYNRSTGPHATHTINPLARSSAVHRLSPCACCRRGCSDFAQPSQSGRLNNCIRLSYQHGTVPTSAGRCFTMSVVARCAQRLGPDAPFCPSRLRRWAPLSRWVTEAHFNALGIRSQREAIAWSEILKAICRLNPGADVCRSALKYRVDGCTIEKPTEYSIDAVWRAC